MKIIFKLTPLGRGAKRAVEVVMKRTLPVPKSPVAAHAELLRLAQGEITAVDWCRCGTVHVHIGAVSLRLHPEALSDLLGTLGAAVARRQAILAERDFEEAPLRREPRWQAGRGDA